jgi:small subunit ribosomal protein S18
MFKEKRKRTKTRTDSFRRGGRGFMPAMKKSCRFCREKIERIDYKGTDILSKYTTEQGKILPSRITGTCASHQRQLAMAIKRARSISLMSFTRE